MLSGEAIHTCMRGHGLFWTVPLRDSEQLEYRLIPGSVQVMCPATDLLVWNEVLFTWRSTVVKYCAPLDHAHYKFLIVTLLHTKNKHLCKLCTSTNFTIPKIMYDLTDSSHIQNFFVFISHITPYIIAKYSNSLLQYTGCFPTLGHNCRRWFLRFLWSKKFLDGYGVMGVFLIPVHALVWTASNSWCVMYSLWMLLTS